MRTAASGFWFFTFLHFDAKCRRRRAAPGTPQRQSRTVIRWELESLMPVVLKVNPQKKVVYSTFFGVVTDNEILEHGQTIRSHPDFRHDYGEIVDLTMVTELKFTRAAMKKLASARSVFEPAVKHVIIAPKDFLFSEAQAFSSLASGNRRNLKVVRTPAEAYEFLGLV